MTRRLTRDVAVLVASGAALAAGQDGAGTSSGGLAGLAPIGGAFWRETCGELCQTVDGFRTKRRRLARNGDLAGQFDPRQSPVQRRDQFLEFPRELNRTHSHGEAPDNRDCRRATFQTSPQSTQRQYASLSGLRTVVEIECDWHSGQTVGTMASAVERA